MATLKIGGFGEWTGSISWNLVLKAQSKPQTSLKDLPGRFAPAQWPVAPDPELTTPTLHGWYEVGDEVGDIWDIANKSMHEKIANKFNVLQKTAKKTVKPNTQLADLLPHPLSPTGVLHCRPEKQKGEPWGQKLDWQYFSHVACVLPADHEVQPRNNLERNWWVSFQLLLTSKCAGFQFFNGYLSLWKVMFGPSPE